MDERSNQLFSIYTMYLFVKLTLVIVLCATKSSACDQVKKEDFLRRSQSSIVSVRYDCQDKNDLLTHCCSGIVLTESYILTTANCVDHLHNDHITIIARSGDQFLSDKTIGEVDRIIIHPNWTTKHDDAKDNIALLHVSNPIDFLIDSSITRACISLSSNHLSNSTPIVIASRDFNTRMNVNLPPNELVRIDDHDVTCQELVDDVEEQFCVRFYRSSKSFLNNFIDSLHLFVSFADSCSCMYHII